VAIRTLDPRNGNHCLRIPERTAPWDSGFLVNPGDRFEVTFAKGGVYAGMPGADQWGPGPGSGTRHVSLYCSIMVRTIVRLQQFSQNRASGRTT